MNNRVLIVAEQVWVIPPYAEAQQPEQLLDEKLPLEQGLLPTKVIIVVRP